MRVAAYGKSFVLGTSPFRFRGVSYRPRNEAVGGLERDFSSIAANGYTVVSMREPPARAVEAAASSGLKIVLELGGVEVANGAGASRREQRRLTREAALRLRELVRPWHGAEALLGFTLGTSGPLGRRVANQLAIALHDDDPGLLAGWRAAAPPGECPPEFDFLLVDCELVRDGLPEALMACHGEVGDRPLVLGAISLQDASAAMDIALRCGSAGTLSPGPPPLEQHEPDPETVRVQWRTVRDLDVDWPALSVVVCAHNAADTLHECLSHCSRLEYPKLEVIVVDDGSTDDTQAIVASHPTVELVTLPHSGLSAARNAGYRSARGDLIAYLDADAYPSPDWPWYLALGALDASVGGASGPNVPPPGATVSAQVVARSPGGPVPQLIGTDRAAQVPGCNMAYWRDVLDQLDGFDPSLRVAADDLEFEWRVLERGYEIAYHPAALVWHHRRPGLLPYLRQQRNYGRSQAILERHYPSRFPAGFRLRRAADLVLGRTGAKESQPSYAVKYLTLPRPGGGALKLAHQWGVPAALVLSSTWPLALARRRLAAPAAAATAFLGVLFGIDVAVSGEGYRRSQRTLGFRARVAAFRLLRPPAFRWGHFTQRRERP